MTRIALACAICAVAVATYFFAAPHLAGIGLHPRADDAHILVAGPVIKSGAAAAPGTNVLPTPSSQLNSGRNADTKSVTNENARTQNPDVSEFYRSLQSRNLFVAHRRLAGMSENGKGPGQLEQMLNGGGEVGKRGRKSGALYKPLPTQKPWASSRS